MIVRNLPIVRYSRGRCEFIDDPVIEENWLDLYVNGKLLIGTPVIDREIEELVYGFLFMEGFLKYGDRIKISREYQNVYTDIPGDFEIKTVKELVDCAYSRIVFKEEIEKLEIRERIKAETLISLMHDFQKLPSVYHETGGVHMAGFAAGDRIEYWSDDISRRNAVDKVLGKLFLSGKKVSGGVMLSSGRVSSDIVMRLIQSGIPMIISVSAPTVKAVELADEYGITICGFARGRRFNVYTISDRIDFGVEV